MTGADAGDRRSSVSADRPGRAPRSIVIVGGGPRGAGVLERLAANLAAGGAGEHGAAPAGGRARRSAPEPLVIHVVEPHDLGAGRVWRDEQSSLLKLNSLARDVTMFTDASSTIDGPVRPGPALDAWAREAREGRVDARVDPVTEPALAAELASLGPGDFPTRRLQHRYLSWFARRTIASLPAHVRVVHHRATAIDVAPGGGASGAFAAPGARHRIRLSTGEELGADVAILTTGHTSVRPDPDAHENEAFAARHGLVYVAPDFTADADLSRIPAGETVLVRGLGLAAIDLVVLLAEGRGGAFERVPDDSAGPGLRYRPSGREPLLVLGSRRGVPYRAKPERPLAGEPYAPHAFSPAVARELVRTRAVLDFREDVWPLIARELLHAHYRELFTGHPERVRGDWAGFAARLDRVQVVAEPFARAEGEGEGEGTGPGERPGREAAPDDARPVDPLTDLRRLVEAFVPDPADRLVLHEFDRPLDGRRFASRSALDARVREHLLDDAARRTQPEGTTSTALFVALLHSYLALAEIVDAPNWTTRSILHDLPGAWHGFFSSVASGPPAPRLRELVALMDAGVVSFLGAGVRIERDEGSGRFRATSESLRGEPAPAGAEPGAESDAAASLAAARAAEPARSPAEQPSETVVVARALVDAWLPAQTAAGSTNPLVRSLLASGDGRIAVAGREGASTGLLEVSRDEHRVIDAHGRAHDALFALGPVTTAPNSGAFARPGTNGVSFRQHDRVARAVLRALGVPSVDRPSVRWGPIGSAVGRVLRDRRIRAERERPAAAVR